MWCTHVLQHVDENNIDESHIQNARDRLNTTFSPTTALWFTIKLQLKSFIVV